VIITEHVCRKRGLKIAIDHDVFSTIEELETVGAETVLAVLPWNPLYWLLVTVGTLLSHAKSARRRPIEAQTSLDEHIHEYEYDCECRARVVSDCDVEIAA
jgi:hypothetical protein